MYRSDKALHDIYSITKLIEIYHQNISLYTSLFSNWMCLCHCLIIRLADPRKILRIRSNIICRQRTARFLQTVSFLRRILKRFFSLICKKDMAKDREGGLANDDKIVNAIISRK